MENDYYSIAIGNIRYTNSVVGIEQDKYNSNIIRLEDIKSKHDLDVIFNFLKVSPIHKPRLRNVLNHLRDVDFRLICFGSSIKGTADSTSDIDLAYETYQYTMLDKDAIYKEILNAYYDDRYRNNSIDIMYINDLDKSSFLYHEIQSGLILKDFRRLNNNKFT